MPHVQLRSACLAAMKHPHPHQHPPGQDAPAPAFKWQHPRAGAPDWAVWLIHMTGVYEPRLDGTLHVDRCGSPTPRPTQPMCAWAWPCNVSSSTFSSLKGREQNDSSTPAVKVVLASQQKLPLQGRVLARLRSERVSSDARPAGNPRSQTTGGTPTHPSATRNLDH